jgi:hypothetical protein
MIIDEVVVERLIWLQKAYPSMSDNAEHLVDEVNSYFSKETTEQRVSVLCKAMKSGKVAGKLLYPYYPLLLFHSKKFKDGRKIVLDSKTNGSELEIFKKACVAFGIPSYLKKHGNSSRRVFRLLPSFSELDLDKARRGHKVPEWAWLPIWNYLTANRYLDYSGSHEWYLKAKPLQFPNSFWGVALSKLEELPGFPAVIGHEVLKNKDVVIFVEKQ